jgi:hypothetical protein
LYCFINGWITCGLDGELYPVFLIEFEEVYAMRKTEEGGTKESKERSMG